MHFEYIAAAASHGIDAGGRRHRRPDGVRRADDDDRGAGGGAVGDGAGNKGREAAAAALEMATLFRKLDEGIERMTASTERRSTRRARKRSLVIARAKRRCRCSISGRSAARRCATVRRDVLDARGRTAGRRSATSCATFATTLATGIAATVADIDPLIAEAAEHWRIERMNVLDRLILRLAVYEFLHEPETPAKVIINEALELARTFSTDDSVRFINGDARRDPPHDWQRE